MTQTSGSTNKARDTFLKIMHILGGKQQNIPVHAIIDQRKDDIKSRDRSKICTCEQKIHRYHKYKPKETFQGSNRDMGKNKNSQGKRK